MLEPRATVAAMAAYALPDLSAPDGVSPVVLAQNEHAFAPSATVRDAVANAVADGHLYPDSEWRELRATIARVRRLGPERIICGSGSMELMQLLVAAYVRPGDRILMTAYGYLFMRTLAQAADARVDDAPEPDMRVDVDALLARVTPDTRLVFVVNPGNPSGTVIPNDEIRRLRAALDDDVLLLVDEAYAEFVAAGFHAPLFDLVEQGNTMVTRTFSKIYGLAGLRVGWAYASDELCANLRKVQIPGNLSRLSQVAAATAMQDQAGALAARAEIAGLRDLLTQGLADLGLEVVPSSTNFVLIDFGDSDAARSAFEFLRARGIIVRPMGGYRLPSCLRVSIGIEAHMQRTVEALAAWRAAS